MDTGNDARRCDEDQLAQPALAKDCGMISDEKRRSAVDELLLAATGAYRHVDALDVIANAVGVDISGEGLHDAEEMVYGALADLIDRPTCRMKECRIDHGSCSWGMRRSDCGHEFEHEKPECWWRFCPNCHARVVTDDD